MFLMRFKFRSKVNIAFGIYGKLDPLGELVETRPFHNEMYILAHVRQVAVRELTLSHCLRDEKTPLKKMRPEALN